VAAQSARERQRIKEGAGELEVEVLGVQVGIAQAYWPRVAGGRRCGATGPGAAALGQAQRVESDFEHALAVRLEAYAARQHGAGREPRIDEVKITERRRVGVQGQIEQQRAPRPRYAAPRRPQRGPGKLDPRQ